MSAFLPQHVSQSQQAERQKELSQKREIYQYNYTHIPALAVLDKLPIEDDFSFGWLEMVSKQVMKGIKNRCELEGDQKAREHHEKRHSKLVELFEKGEFAIHEIRERVREALHFSGRIGAPKTSAKTLEDFSDMFRAYGLPPIAKNYQEDSMFAHQRIAGPNPVMLKRMKQLDERLPVTNEMYQIAVPGDSLDAALDEGRLYLADYAILDGAELGTKPNGQKYIYAPLALFAIAGPRRRLTPIAIQCKQTPSPDNPVFTPDDGNNWLIAKTIVEIADGNLHEGSTHLARTHLAMEAFLLATYRHLAVHHPLYVLLSPHFEGTLAINDSAWKHLISVGGAVDLLLAGTIETSRGVAKAGLQSLSVMEDRLPLTFQRQGVDDHEAFPDYPYRDDSLLYWDAIHEWAGAYIRLYYKSDEDVVQDAELQAWGKEIVSKDGGRLKGLPNGGAISNVGDLVEVITFVLYTCSVQHAAVNFPQADYMTYCPGKPLAGYRPAPTTKQGASESDYLAMLPTLDMAELQMEVCDLLGSVHYTTLGHYRAFHFLDRHVHQPLREFQQRLSGIGETISERNASRIVPYDTLTPSSIPQSINI